MEERDEEAIQKQEELEPQEGLRDALAEETEKLEQEGQEQEDEDKEAE